MDQSPAPEPFAELPSFEKAVIQHASDQKVMLDDAAVLSLSLRLEKELRDCPPKYRDEMVKARLKGPEYSRHFKPSAAGQGQAASANRFQAAADRLRAKYFGDQS